MCVCVCVSGCAPRRHTGASGAGVTDISELSSVRAGIHTLVLIREQQAPLTPGPSLQPLKLKLSNAILKLEIIKEQSYRSVE